MIVVISDFAHRWNQEPALLRGLGMREHNVKLILCAIDEWEEFSASSYAMALRDPRSGLSRGYCREELRELKLKMSAHFAAIEESVRPLSAFFIRIPILTDPLAVVKQSLRRLGFK